MFVERFREVAHRQPDAVAVEERDSTLSFGDLYRISRMLGMRLNSVGIGREKVVGLGMRKSADFVYSMLGAWYAGAAFLPLDPNLPQARLELVLRDAGMPMVITRSEDSAAFEAFDPRRLYYLDDPCAPRQMPFGSPKQHNLDDLAYLIYTSGSTGVPKGVQVTQRGLLPLIDGQIPAFGLRPGSRVLWLLSPSFDASISDLGTTLLSGATLCIEPGSAVETAADLLRVVAERGITHLDLPPSLLSVLDPAAAPACLETLIIGGEPCPPEVVRRWARRCRVVNVYGPTEATVCSSLGLCDPETWDRPLLGQPLPGVGYHLLDAALRPVPNGEPGELCISGPGLARGYLGRPELTAQRFVEIAGERLYRTGDRVVRHPDGEYEFLGRIDRQVKLRGQLVSPEEIEHCLREHPAVAQAAVVKRRIGNGVGLAAFVVPAAPWDAATEGTVRTHLAMYLPAWMLPQHLEPVPALPVTRIGKTDLAALEAIPLASISCAAAVAPRNEAEAALLAVWQGVLGRPDFGVTDDFFDLGGDSLAVLRAVAQAEALGCPCPPGLLMRHRTVRGVVEATAAGANGAAGRTSEELRRAVSRDYAGVLSPPLNGRAEPPPSAEAPARILLTGATGFLGARLLWELLARTSAEIVCLVRAESEAAGRERCRLAVEAHGLSLGKSEFSRLRVLPGDLERPRFGLEETAWSRLAAETDTIHHCGARVHLVESYEQLRSANVDGTAEVLSLMRSGRRKRLHYVSTLSVFVATDRVRTRFMEDDDLSGDYRVYGGYTQAKWAAEHLVRRYAEASGDPVRSYRLGLITGDTRTGYAPARDQLGLFLRGLQELGAYPARLGERLRVDITPVDFAAAALAYLSLRPGASTGITTFHVASPRGATLEELAQAVCRAGHDVVEVSREAWQRGPREERFSLATNASSTAYVSLCRALGDASGFARQRTLDLFQATAAIFDEAHARAALAGSGLTCPAADPGLLDLYVRRALER